MKFLHTTGFINVRGAPGLNGQILTQLYNGTQVSPSGDTVQADGYEWRRITYSVSGAGIGGTGWIAKVWDTWDQQFIDEQPATETSKPKPTTPAKKPATNGKWAAPVRGRYVVTSPYSAHHLAIDLHGEVGLPIVAATTGDVVHHNAYYIWGYGEFTLIRYQRPTGKGYLFALYAHLRDAPLVRVGQSVNAGSIIGYLGNTGNSTGPHLHLEVRQSSNPNPVFFDCQPVNPRDYFNI